MLGGRPPEALVLPPRQSDRRSASVYIASDWNFLPIRPVADVQHLLETQRKRKALPGPANDCVPLARVC